MNNRELARSTYFGKAVSTTSRGVLRDALTGDLREWNRTAVTEDLKRPEIMDGFRMPHGNNDTELAGRARAFIKAVGDLKLHDAFLEHGLEDDFEDALDVRIGDFEDSKDTQSAAGQETTGAADALVNNLFKGNATVIGEWATASHVERQGTRKAKPAAGGGTAPAPKPLV